MDAQACLQGVKRVSAGQFALFRVIFGAYLLQHFLWLLPSGAELFSNPVVTNWHDLGLMRYTNGIWRYSDTNSTNFPRRYYRVRQQ